eukprot:UN18657
MLNLTFEENNAKSIYFPNSSWNQGRNLLLFLMMLFEKETQIYFNYFVFRDGDLHVAYANIQADFVQPLLEWKPAIGTVDNWTTSKGKRKPMCSVGTFDAQFNAFQRTILKYI